jgi:hypothetical protein
MEIGVVRRAATTEALARRFDRHFSPVGVVIGAWL